MLFIIFVFRDKILQWRHLSYYGVRLHFDFIYDVHIDPGTERYGAEQNKTDYIILFRKSNTVPYVNP